MGALVVAHRGASAYLPEHTLPAYAVAWGMGVDLVEVDVVLSRDGTPFCLHDLTLDRMAVNLEPLARLRSPDGLLYAADLAADQLLSLRVRRGDSRSPGYAPCTLAQVIELLAEANARSGRATGLLIELKDPAFHQARGLDLAGQVLETLRKHLPDGMPCALQSFGIEALRMLRNSGCGYPLVPILDRAPTAAELDEMLAWADGLSLKDLLLEDLDGRATDLAARLSARAGPEGQPIFCWTFGRDGGAIVRFVEQHGVRGVITDNPDIAAAALSRAGIRRMEPDP